MNKHLEELVLKAIESDDKKELDNILTLLKDEKITDASKESLSLIIDSWQENQNSRPNTANFVIELANFFDDGDFPELRAALIFIVKSLLPANVNKTAAIKAIGIRDGKIPLSKVYARYNCLCKLQQGQVFHNNLSKVWGITGAIDWIVGTITLFNFNGTLTQEMELESFLDNSCLFKDTDELKSLQKIKNIPNKNEIIAKLKEYSVTTIDDNKLKNVLLELLVPGIFSLDEFYSWYRTDDMREAEHKLTTPQSARSIQELHRILIEKQAATEIFTKEVKSSISNVLNLLKPSSTLKEYLLWADCICLLIDHYSKEEIHLLTPINKQVQDIVWPVEPEENNEICVGIWTQLKALNLSSWIRYTEEVRGIKHLKQILNYLPWKVWPILTNKLGTTFVESIIEETNKITSPEMLLWMWKNKAKIRTELLCKLNYTVVIPAIHKSKSGTLWQAAPKELKKLLLENDEFQKLILKDESETGIVALLEFLHNTQALAVHDRQTLIVKLSRLSDKIKAVLQSEKAKLIITSRQYKSESLAKNETFITSFKSYNEKIAELQDIINRQIPENTEAIATARAHGDLRENAEFAAAKERQKFLNEYRALLESKIAVTRPTDFFEIQISDTVVVGTTVTIEYEDKTAETFHVLGAWDSNPAKKYISYETDLGQAVIGQKINSSVVLPGNRACKIVKISPLPKDIINELRSNN